MRVFSAVRVCVFWYLLVLVIVLSEDQASVTPYPEYYESVDDAPFIYSRGGDTYATLRENVTLSCLVEGLGGHNIVWRRGDILLWVLQNNEGNLRAQKALDDPRLVLDNSSLVILNVSSKEEGLYICEVTSQPPLNVRYRVIVQVPPSAKAVKRLVTVKKGGNVTLACSVEGTPLPSVSWAKTDGSHIKGDKENELLHIYYASTKDAGDYECTADNGVEPEASSKVTLQVFFAPEVMAEPKNVFAGVSSSARLSCIVSGEPFPKIRWFKGTTPVDPMRFKTYYKDEDMKFFIRFDRVRKSDFGEYSCQAANYMGEGQDMLILTGRPKPAHILGLSGVTVSRNLTLVWEVESYSPILDYLLQYRNSSEDDSEWINITVPGSASFSSSLFQSQEHTFHDLIPGSTFTAQVQARNEFGVSDVNETLAFMVEVDDTGDVINIEKDKVFLSKDTNTSFVKLADSSQGSYGRSRDNFSNAANFPIVEITDKKTEKDANSGSLSPAAKKAQMTAIITVISLSSFFL